MIAGAEALVRRVLTREPVRVRLYSIVIAVLAIEAARGDIHPGDATLYGGLAAAVLGVESARAKVTPVAKPKARRKPPTP